MTHFNAAVARRFTRLARFVAIFICLTVQPFGSSVYAANKQPKLVLAGPAASVSMPLIHMLESNALAHVADKVEFIFWKDPDQLRLLALGGKADFLAMPSNVAANLYNRGQRLKLLNISTWGVLWLVSRQANLKTLADFRGKEIAMPFRADMPDIVFALIAEQEGLNPKEDFTLRYVASPLDAMQLLITRRVDHALLAEPAISMALRKTQSFPISVIAPELFRSVDLQQEWGRLFKREARMPQAGVAVLGNAINNQELQNEVMKAYAKSLLWCQQNARACGEMVSKHISLLSPDAVADAIAVSPLQHVTAQAAQQELNFFFQQLLSKNPALIGGKLPDAAFYGHTDTP